MVDLPQVRNDVPVLRAPTSPVSPSQVAQPYAQVSSLLEEAGKETEAVSTKLADKAGIEAVTRDADGNLQVERLPIVGPAAEHFSRAVEWTGFALSAGDARRADLVIARQYQNDPDGYLKAADAFRKDFVAKVTQKLGPRVGVELSRSIDGITTQQFNSILAQQQAKIRRDFDQSTTAVITNDSVDLQNLIKSGGLDTPAGRQQANQLINRITRTLNERSTNPVLGVPPQVTATLLKQFDENVGAWRFADRIRKTVNDTDGGIEKAQTEIDENFDDQLIPPTQRVKNREVALDTIKEITQDRTRAANQAAKLQKQLDDAFENKVLESTAAGGEPGDEWTEDRIKKAIGVSPAAKMKMLNYIKRDGMPEPLAAASQLKAKQLIGLIRSGQMGTNGAIYDAYDAGELRKPEFDFVNSEFEKLRGPGGEKLGKAKAAFFNAVKASITDSDPIRGKLNKSGDLQLYRFEQDVTEAMDARRKEGKDPYDLLNPNKPEFMGTSAALQQYQIPFEQAIKNITDRLRRQTPAAPVPTTQPSRNPGESQADFLKRLGL